MTSPPDRIGHDVCRSPAHLGRWREAMDRGRRAAAKCEHIAPGTGVQCRRPPLREARAAGIMLCHNHLTGAVRIEIDQQAEPRVRRWLTSENAIRRQRAADGLAAASRRRLVEAWKLNADLPDATIALATADEGRVREWLAKRRVALDDPLPQTGHPPSPRAQDRLRWLAARHLSGRADDRAAAWDLKKITRDEGRWQKRKAALLAAGQPLPLPDWPTFGTIPKTITIEPPAPPSKARKAANVARLRTARAHQRIEAKTTEGAAGDDARTRRPGDVPSSHPVEKANPTAPPPPYASTYSPAFVEIINTLRASLDLDHQTEAVQDRIGRAAWSYAHGGMSAAEWAKLRRDFRVLCGCDDPASHAPGTGAGAGAAAAAAAFSTHAPGW